MDDEVRRRDLSLLNSLDDMLGELKVKPTDRLKLKLRNALKWIQDNLNVEKLDEMFQEISGDFKHLKNLKKLVSTNHGDGIDFDWIDRIVTYRKANDKGELDEILRLESDGCTYFKGQQIFRCKELYVDIAEILD